MTKALERAAKALFETHDGLEDIERAAKAALLAALDPEDEALVDAIADIIDEEQSDYDVPSSGHKCASLIIPVLRNHICGETNDDS